jgi:hypothetical protein
VPSDYVAVGRDDGITFPSGHGFSETEHCGQLVWQEAENGQPVLRGKLATDCRTTVYNDDGSVMTASYYADESSFDPMMGVYVMRMHFTIDDLTGLPGQLHLYLPGARHRGAADRAYADDRPRVRSPVVRAGRRLRQLRGRGGPEPTAHQLAWRGPCGAAGRCRSPCAPSRWSSRHAATRAPSWSRRRARSGARASARHCGRPLSGGMALGQPSTPTSTYRSMARHGSAARSRPILEVLGPGSIGGRSHAPRRDRTPRRQIEVTPGRHRHRWEWPRRQLHGAGTGLGRP